ncbi:porin [Puniceibacterium sp. IMCC21224]|uniref:porin n=1 Tax=Puniceibacterium sp. IMCC21224 TaxID=1618204 RepID=UPI00064DD8C7|nr:porin [Puniceibacterium sp. IMCC21224]KMK68740.1 Gram-negative porin [Puniceibacterium sp. IMCC21224]
MKKILFATTALVASAGIASAQDLGVAVSGFAEMGIYNPSTEFSDTQFFTTIDVTFRMTGETDNGLSFGATIDLDEAADRNNVGRFERPFEQGGENMFVSFGGATLTMGDTDGAYDRIVPEMNLAGAGSIADDETTHVGFNAGAFLDGGVLGSDGQIARFDYAYSAFTFALSLEQVADGAKVAGAGETIMGLGVGYSGEFSGVTVTAGLGYQSLEDFASETGVGVVAGFSNGFSAGVTYTKYEIDGGTDFDHVGLGVGYSMNALAVGLNWGRFEDDNGVEESGYGLAVNYDLGGGMVAQLGYSHDEYFNSTEDNRWSLGVAMSF